MNRNIPQDLFCLTNKEIAFANQFFIKIKDILYPIHPIYFESNQKAIINHFPSEEEWRSIFTFFPFKDILAFAQYYNKLEQYLPTEQTDTILKSYNLNPNPKIRNEIKNMIKLNAIAIIFFVEKAVPIDILLNIQNNNSNILDLFAPFLLQPYIKKNIIKEILNEIPELTMKEIEDLIIQFKNVTNEINNDGKHFLNQHYKQIIMEKKYPLYSNLKKEKDNKLNSLKKPSIVRINYNPYFENDDLEIQVIIKNTNDFNTLKDFLNNEITKTFFSEDWFKT